MNRKYLSIILVFVMVLMINGTVFAEDTGTGDDDTTDPGVSSDQDETKTDTIKWILPHGDTFILDDEEINVVLDWESLDITSEREVGEGNVLFVGIDSSIEGDDSGLTTCGNGNGLGNCNSSTSNNGNGNGSNNGNGSGPLPGSDCGNVWVTPGGISAKASKVAPSNPVVINQDPNDTGVTLEWQISIQPTTVSYEKWKIVGHRQVACVEDDSKGNNDSSSDGDCPSGWKAVIEHIWACSVTTKTYKERFDELLAGASLTLNSRAWITGELASAYPGATLQHPDWSYSQSTGCAWKDEVCVLSFSANIPVVDPGWYDIKVSGETSGTRVSPARGFDITAGEFGVYLLDNTSLAQ